MLYEAQTAFTILLPLIKLLMRNLFARAARHLGDETPELVIFNADAFEFLLLLNYIEVVIPQIFAIYLIVTYHLPNREYYSVFYNMNESQLYATLKNLLVYWFLQLLSLLGLDMLLRRMLGLSPVRVLAFVLERQVDYVQIYLTYWLCYNAHCTLKHIGYDYSFHFSWLSN
ncbi:uncharacterized protein IUM83_04633 [Phytophthora cinnamomi]|uniref:uncharacterized protein n=1 Tax=Phytophthora cinnamomi TaxID=4785 RepID=UPI0035595B56|nr:hypothetical protein IUM83_04633 [Phytophthora cinnamomi]